MKRMVIKRHNILISAVLIVVLCLTGVVYATNLVQPKSDLEWAESAGFLTDKASAEEQITQAEFLKLVMITYNAKEKGVVVPRGAENHWAAEFYATAKKEGLIDCSCQIKPDQPMTLEEAARFVMLGINRKANKQLLNMTTVKAWVTRKEASTAITFGDAATLLRKMHEAYEANDLNDM